MSKYPSKHFHADVGRHCPTNSQTRANGILFHLLIVVLLPTVLMVETGLGVRSRLAGERVLGAGRLGIMGLLQWRVVDPSGGTLALGEVGLWMSAGGTLALADPMPARGQLVRGWALDPSGGALALGEVGVKTAPAHKYCIACGGWGRWCPHMASASSHATWVVSTPRPPVAVEAAVGGGEPPAAAVVAGSHQEGKGPRFFPTLPPRTVRGGRVGKNADVRSREGGPGVDKRKTVIERPGLIFYPHFWDFVDFSEVRKCSMGRG